MIDGTLPPDESNPLDGLANDPSRAGTAATQDFDFDQYQLPITYFGCKRRVVIPVWLRLGVNAPDYREIFAGSGAVFWGRPLNLDNSPRRELLNDDYSELMNAYRTIKYASPDKIADICREPYFETDIVAWNKFLIRNRVLLRSKLQQDPEFFDLELGARWIWLIRGWIGGGAGNQEINVRRKMIRAKIPAWKLGSPELLFARLKDRLKDTQIFNHNYDRALSSKTQNTAFRIIAVFMDPPYPKDFCRESYAIQTSTVAYEAFEKAIELGRDPRFRIAYCGYGRVFGSAFAKEGWEQIPCVNGTGYSNQAANGRGRDNRRDEYIWFSRHCLKVK
jgi:site-specific DNA-adenine methylase